MPQFIIAIIIALNVVTGTVKHGEPRSDYNAYVAAFDAVTWAALLYWGGFFA